MKKHSMPEMKEGGVNVTPLIDVVMCLIIFFMLVTKIGVSRGVDKDIRLPETIMGGKLEDMGNALTLNIHQEKQPDGFPAMTAGNATGEIREVKSNELVPLLKEFKRVHGVATKVIIRGDQDLLYKQLSMVLLALHDAKISDTAYETKLATPGAAAAEAPAAPQ